MSTPQPVLPTLDAERQDLVEAHLSLVRDIAARWRPRCRSNIDHADLVQVGALGLIEAARRFDPGRRDRFRSFAALRIQGAIQDHLRSHDPLSRSRRRAVRELESARERLRGDAGEEPTSEELAATLGWDARAVDAARSDLAALASGWAGTPESPEEAPSPWQGKDAPDPHEELLRKEQRSLLVEAMARLSERERQVLSLRHVEALTLAEVGEVLGVSESRACQLHSRALRRLRAAVDRLTVTEAAPR